MCQPNFLAMTMMACHLRPSLVSMSTTMEITFDRSFCGELLLLGSHGGASLLETSPDSIDCWNRYTKLGPFFSASSFDCNFQPNNNQTFIVYVKSTLVLYRKGLCGFFSFGIRPGTKAMWSKVLQVLRTRGSTYYYTCQHKYVSHPPQEGSNRSLAYCTLLGILW